MANKSTFVGKRLHYGDLKEQYVKSQLYGHLDLRYTESSTQWVNRRPICPYGCGEEGNLLEVVMKDGKALGIYTHSGNIKPFTAELQIAPKPTGRKIAIGPDGEPHMVDEESTS